MSKEQPGLRVIRMPRRYGIPIIGRYLYWKLKRKITKQLESIGLDDIVISTRIPKDKWLGREIGIRDSELV